MNHPFCRRSARACWLGALLLAAVEIAGCSEASDDIVLPAEDERNGVAGTLGARVTSYADHAETTYRLVRDDGEAIELAFGTDAPRAHVGRRILVRGARAGNRIEVDGYDVVRRETESSSLEQPVIGPVKRTFRVAAISLEPTFSAAEFRSRVFGAFDSLAAVYAENSYGQWSIEGDVFGPYSIPVSCADSDATAVAAAAKAAAAADGLDPSQYDNFLYRMPASPACSWSVRSDIGVSEIRGFYNGANSWYIPTDCVALTQSVGINFGLRHAHVCAAPPYVTSRYGGSDCEGFGEFGDPFSPMGGGCGHFSTPESAALGFIRGCNTLDVTSSGTFEIGPLEAQCAGPQVIRVDAKSIANLGPQYIYVEYRTGMQSVRSDVVSRRGIYIHASADYGGNLSRVVDSGHGREFAVDSFYLRGPIDAVDTMWTEPSSGAAFKLLAIGATATVEVTLPAGSPGPAHCIDGETPPDTPMCAPTRARFRDGGATDGSGNWVESADSSADGRGAPDGGIASSHRERGCSCATPGTGASPRAAAAIVSFAAVGVTLRRRRSRRSAR